MPELSPPTPTPTPAHLPCPAVVQLGLACATKLRQDLSDLSGAVGVLATDFFAYCDALMWGTLPAPAPAPVPAPSPVPSPAPAPGELSERWMDGAASPCARSFVSRVCVWVGWGTRSARCEIACMW